MVAGDGGYGASGSRGFRGSESGRKRGEHATARHWNLDVAEIQKRMSAKKNAVRLHRGDRAGGIDGRVALDQDHSGHIARDNVPIVRARRGGSALPRHETTTSAFRGALPQC